MSNTAAFPWKRPNLMRLEKQVSRPYQTLMFHGLVGSCHPHHHPTHVCGSANRMKTKTANKWKVLISQTLFYDRRVS